jgi:hypothetical protein
MTQVIEIFSINTELLSIDSIVESKSKSKMGKVKYNNQLFKLRLPPLLTKYGISKFTDDKGKDTYSLGLEIDENIKNKILEIENKLIDLAFHHTDDLIDKSGFQPDEKDLFGTKFTSSVKYSKYDNDNEYPSLRPKIFCGLDKNNNLNFYPLEIYVKNPNPNLNKALSIFPTNENKHNPIPLINQSSKVSCVIDASNMWGLSGRFGNSLKVIQIALCSPKEKRDGCLITFTPDDFNVIL